MLIFKQQKLKLLLYCVNEGFEHLFYLYYRYICSQKIRITIWIGNTNIL